MIKIRLQRNGKKSKPFYHIVVADVNAPRDGRFIEKLGTYNPIVSPSKIKLNIDRCLLWLKNGAHPTHTARSILSYKGVLYKKHLKSGVLKGIITEEEMEIKFNNWIDSKNK